MYLGGEIIPQEKATISASDHGFLFGAALFETFRTYRGSPFLLTEHLERMRAGCRALDIDFARAPLLGDGERFPRLREVLRQLLAVNQFSDAAFRFTISAGEADGVLPSAPYGHPVEVVHIRLLPPRLAAPGQRLHVLETKRTEPEVWPRLKSTHYINSLSGYRELRRRQIDPGDEGLMLTRDGRLAEGVVSNLFLVTTDGLQTPSLSAGILAGVTRQAILRLAGKADIAAVEKDLALCDLAEAEGIFTTNSTRGITAVYEVLDSSGQRVWAKNSSTHPTVIELTAAYEHLTQGE